MQKTAQIAEFGQKLMALGGVESALSLISEEAKELLRADRCSIFIVDAEDKMLWTKVADGIGRIVIRLDSGIVGDTYMKKEPQLVNNPYEDERFLTNIDKKTGYVTRNMITTPIYDSKREIIGIIQLLNKSRGDFNEDDLADLAFLANYVSGSLELILMSEK